MAVKGRPFGLPDGWIQREIKEAFTLACKGRTHPYLTKEGYKISVISLLGYKPTSRDVGAIWARAKEDALRLNQVFHGIPFCLFKEVILQKWTTRDSTNLNHQVFVAFDVECQGFLTISDCSRAFNEIMPWMSEESISKVFDSADIDHDGRISFTDFEIMMLNSIYSIQKES